MRTISLRQHCKITSAASNPLAAAPDRTVAPARVPRPNRPRTNFVLHACRKFSVGTTLLVLVGLSPAARCVEFNSALSSIHGSDLQAVVEVLADPKFEGREAGSRGGHAAGDYLAKQFELHRLRGAGDQGAFSQTFRGTCRNVLGILEGSDEELRNQHVVVCAHYDHVGYGTAKNSRGPIGVIHPGADDNASGVAGVLQTLAALASLDQRPKRSILFALWDAEEKGLWGSKHWIANPTVPLRDVVFAVNADMIGRVRNQQLRVYGTRTSYGLRQFVSLQNQATDLLLDFTWDFKEEGDHYSFYSRAIPVLAFHAGLHDDYHRPSDRADKINRDGVEQTTRLLFSTTYGLANSSEWGGFRDACRRESAADRLRLEQPLPPAPPRFGANWEPRADQASGLVVTQVVRGTAAEQAGIQIGDRLLRVADRKADDDAQVRMAILAARSPLEVVLQHQNEEPRTLSVPLAGSPQRIGLSWREDDGERHALIVTRVIYGSAAALAGLEPGDRIYQVAGQDFADGAEFLQQTASCSGPLELLVERRGRLKSVTLRCPENN